VASQVSVPTPSVCFPFVFVLFYMGLLAREADNLPQSSAEVKSTWSCTSILPYAFMVWGVSTNATLCGCETSYFICGRT
jgi:hypothetical protein